MKYIALVFLAFIVGVVILADTHHLPSFVTALYDFPNGDKVGHFILLGLLNFFITRAFLSALHGRPRGWVTLSIGLILAFLITLEEFSQKYFSARTFDLFDLLASFLGVLLGGWLANKTNIPKVLSGD
ncbi:MAG: VanZ family protein [Chloroflexi bacterium]|nr:VanZ family protein [Chloroflexota bacterium]